MYVCKLTLGCVISVVGWGLHHTNIPTFLYQLCILNARYVCTVYTYISVIDVLVSHCILQCYNNT